MVNYLNQARPRRPALPTTGLYQPVTRQPAPTTTDRPGVTQGITPPPQPPQPSTTYSPAQRVDEGQTYEQRQAGTRIPGTGVKRVGEPGQPTVLPSWAAQAKPGIVGPTAIDIARGGMQGFQPRTDQQMVMTQATQRQRPEQAQVAQVAPTGEGTAAGGAGGGSGTGTQRQALGSSGQMTLSGDEAQQLGLPPTGQEGQEAEATYPDGSKRKATWQNGAWRVESEAPTTPPGTQDTRGQPQGWISGDQGQELGLDALRGGEIWTRKVQTGSDGITYEWGKDPNGNWGWRALTREEAGQYSEEVGAKQGTASKEDTAAINWLQQNGYTVTPSGEIYDPKGEHVGQVGDPTDEGWRTAVTKSGEATQEAAARTAEEQAAAHQRWLQQQADKAAGRKPPELNEETLNEMIQAQRQSRALDLANSMSAYYEQAARAGVSPEAASATGTQVGYRSGVEGREREARTRMQAQLTNLQSAMTQYQTDIRMIESMMQMTNDRETLDRLQRGREDLQRQQARANEDLLRLQHELSKPSVGDVLGGIFGTIGGAALGTLAGGPIGALAGAGASGITNLLGLGGGTGGGYTPWGGGGYSRPGSYYYSGA